MGCFRPSPGKCSGSKGPGKCSGIYYPKKSVLEFISKKKCSEFFPLKIKEMCSEIKYGYHKLPSENKFISGSTT
jgi:hypothetical protein